MAEKELLDVLQDTLGTNINYQNKTDDDMVNNEQSSTVSINALEPVFKKSSSLYGIEPIARILKLLEKHIIANQGGVFIESHKVHDASTNLSQLLSKARLGESQLVGGFQKNAGPVLVISVEQLADVIGVVMNKKSLVDMLPASRDPLYEELTLPVGAPASSMAVKL